MMLRCHGKLLCLAFAGMLANTCVSATVSVAASTANPTLRVGYPQPSGAMLPLWLVSDAKLDQSTASRCKIFLFLARHERINP